MNSNQRISLETLFKDSATDIYIFLISAYKTASIHKAFLLKYCTMSGKTDKHQVFPILLQNIVVKAR